MISSCSLIATLYLALSAQVTPSQGPRLVAQVGHSGPISALAFSRDHRILVTASSTGPIVWDVASGRVIWKAVGRFGGGAGVALSPDNRYLATIAGPVTVWDLTTGLPIQTINVLPQPGAASVAFSPTKPQLAIGSKNLAVYLCDFKASGELQAFPIPPVPPQYQGSEPPRTSVTSLVFSADGTTLASGNDNGTAGLWSLTTHQLLRAFSGGSPDAPLGFGSYGSQGGGAIAISPDGSTLANGRYMWNIATGQPLRQFFVSRNQGSSVAFLSNQTFVSAEQGGATHVIDTASGRELHIVGPAAVQRVIGRAQAFRGPPRVQPTQFRPAATLSSDGQLLAASGQDGVVQIWDVSSGKTLASLRSHADALGSVALAPDGSSLAIGGPQGVWFWDSAGTPTQLLTDPGFHAVAFSPDGRSLACAGDRVSVWDVQTKGALAGWAVPSETARRLVFSPDGKFLAGGWGNGATLWDFPTGVKRFELGDPSPPRTDGAGPFVRFSPDGRILAMAGGAQIGNSARWDLTTGTQLSSLGYSSLAAPRTDLPKLNAAETGISGPSFQRQLEFRLRDANGVDVQRFTPADGYLIGNMAASPDGKTLATLESPFISLWDSSTGMERRTLRGHADDVTDVSFSSKGSALASLSRDRTVKLWNSLSGQELCTITSFDSGAVAVVDPEGRFDVSSLEGDVWLSWVAPDAPLTPLPIEIFTRDYFEPGLLAKVLHHEKLRPVKSIADLNRAQPTISLTADVRGDQAKVTVTAGDGRTEVMQDGRALPQVGHPQDLRLFLDGKLVGYQDGPLGAGAAGRWSNTFTVPLPHNAEREVELSAYCFNQSRVKSATVRKTLALDLAPRKGKAYVISVGVDHYRRPDLALSFSAADATSISDTLRTRLTGYSDVVSVPLLSNASHHDATKMKFHAVLDALAGRRSDLVGIPNAEKLAKATPEDLVIISWSGHGLSSKEGQFYLLPEDVKNDPDTFGKAFLASCVGTDELTSWLRDVNAADMVLIVDACHSAAAVQSEEFKPGPLGNRGLGQLAYDKGIRVLAATQAANVALESGQLGNGLLTYALIHDGLGGGKTPTIKEWLAATIIDVPRLYAALESGTLKAAKGARGGSLQEEKTPDKEFRQRPALFDFTRRPSPVPFVGPVK